MSELCDPEFALQRPIEQAKTVKITIDIELDSIKGFSHDEVVRILTDRVMNSIDTQIRETIIMNSQVNALVAS